MKAASIIRGVWRLAAVAVLSTSIIACTTQPRACTEMGGESGVAVVVSAELAAGLTALTLQTCWVGADCTSGLVILSPAADTVDQGCSGTDPDDACSATVVPNSTLQGFHAVPNLPDGPIQVGATLAYGGQVETLTAIETRASVVSPNGEGCPPILFQARVRADSDGLHAG